MSNATVRIGVATTVQPKKRHTQSGDVVRPAFQYVRLAEEAAAQGAEFFLFHPHKVDWRAQSVTAHVPERPGSPRMNWVIRKMPLPDVIYENVFVHLAIKGYTSQLRQHAQLRSIPLFNPVLPGKWKMVELLNRTGLDMLTPETARLRDAGQVQDWLRRYQVAYVKPIGGYGGMDVNRVERLSTGQYRVSVDRTRTQTGRTRMVLNHAQLVEWIAKKRRRPHLIQRGLRLMSVADRKVDFRVVVHRDRAGHWQIIGIVPKMTIPDGVVTNLIAGGERSDIDTLLRQASREGKQIPIHTLEEHSKQIAGELSKRWKNVALIGFDMAVEEDGRVTMIEMNPKPARSLLTRPMLQRLAHHTIGFALYLADRKRPKRNR